MSSWNCAAQGVRSGSMLQLDGRGLGGQPLLVRLREVLRVWYLMRRNGDSTDGHVNDTDDTDHHMQLRSVFAAVRQMSDGSKVIINVDLDR